MFRRHKNLVPKFARLGTKGESDKGSANSDLRRPPFIALIQGEAEEKTRGGERGIGWCWTRTRMWGGNFNGATSFLLNGKIVAEVSVERESRGVKGPLSAPQSRGGSVLRRGGTCWSVKRGQKSRKSRWFYRARGSNIPFPLTRVDFPTSVFPTAFPPNVFHEFLPFRVAKLGTRDRDRGVIHWNWMSSFFSHGIVRYIQNWPSRDTTFFNVSKNIVEEIYSDTRSFSYLFFQFL